MTDKEKSAWIEFIWVVQNLLQNKKSPYYIQHIQQLMLHFQRLGYNMSIKITVSSTLNMQSRGFLEVNLRAFSNLFLIGIFYSVDLVLIDFKTRNRANSYFILNSSLQLSLGFK